jgi:hypothetical protein
MSYGIVVEKSKSAIKLKLEQRRTISSRAAGTA